MKKHTSKKEEVSVSILTISDRSASGERDDVSGKLLKELVSDRAWNLLDTAVVPDEAKKIAEIITKWCSAGASLILTTGGTGIGPRDITPEAVRPLLDLEIPGVGELMRSTGLKKTPFAALSRSLAGVRNGTIIVTLPGSPKGATDSFEAIVSVIPHALSMLKGGSH